MPPVPHLRNFPQLFTSSKILKKIKYDEVR